VDDLWAMKSKDVGLIVRTIRFQDFQPTWSWSTNVTDGQTDRQTKCDRKTALCTIVDCVVKTLSDPTCTASLFLSDQKNKMLISGLFQASGNNART